MSLGMIGYSIPRGSCAIDSVMLSIFGRRSARICAILAIAIMPLGNLRAQASGIPEPTDKTPINETVTDGFVHPGIGYTKAILENARRQVIAKKEPWYSGYKALASHPASGKSMPCRNESPTNPGKPEVDAFDSRSIQDRLKQDSARALRQSLMYIFTGDEAYRTNAMHIIRVWSQMDPAKYKNYNEAHIHASYPVKEMILAAELMRYTGTGNPALAWTEADTQAFTGNFAVPAVNTFLNGNGWFMNQNGYPLVAAMAKDIFTNDRPEYEKRVEWFTVNKTAPNKGWSSSITDLARLVGTNAITGEKVDPPVVQLMEMGRDQAHAGGDVEIFMRTARLMNAQGTKVDPVTGMISTAPDAVGPYEFLDDRILAASDSFCRFMLGYDTPWVPAPYDIGADGKVRGIYPRIADNYRGRIRGLDFWDAYYHYGQKGVDVAKMAPYYHEAFTKRIVASDTDWIYIPDGVSGEPARVPATEQTPAVVEVDLRSTVFDENAKTTSEDGDSFVRITPGEDGTRIAVLSTDTDAKTVAIRVRTTAPVEILMSGFVKPWLIPDTQSEWRDVSYTMDNLEKWGDIVFFTIRPVPAAPEQGIVAFFKKLLGRSAKKPAQVTVDIDKLVRMNADKIGQAGFVAGGDDIDKVTFSGAPVTLDFSAKTAGSVKPVISSKDKPEGSMLDSTTGAFAWTPLWKGDVSFVVNVTVGDAMAAKRVNIKVARDRESAVNAIASAYDPSTPYVESTRKAFQSMLDDVRKIGYTGSERDFAAKLDALQKAANALEPLTPLLPDGSMNYPVIVATSDIGEKISRLTDGNDDTFPEFFLAKDMNYIFDFGPGFVVSVTGLSMEGRLNFETRTQDVALFGSADGKKWTQLSESLDVAPVEMTQLKLKEGAADGKFRYLKIEKTSKASAPLFEPSELRIYGQRHEVSARQQ